MIIIIFGYLSILYYVTKQSNSVTFVQKYIENSKTKMLILNQKHLREID
jgi:hypothetical protein